MLQTSVSASTPRNYSPVHQQTLLKRTQYSTQLNKAKIAYNSGNYQKAIDIWLKILQSSSIDSKSLAQIYCNLASVYRQTGELGKAIRAWQKAIDIYEEESDEIMLARSLTDQAIALTQLGQTRFSLPLLDKALTIAKQRKLERVEIFALLALGNVYSKQNNYDRAIDFYSRSLNKAKSINLVVEMTVSLNNLSNTYFQRSQKRATDAAATSEEGYESIANLARQKAQDDFTFNVEIYLALYPIG
jgi:tetratricopeptide (TPR) repeat protein